MCADMQHDAPLPSTPPPPHLSFNDLLASHRRGSTHVDLQRYDDADEEEQSEAAPPQHSQPRLRDTLARRLSAVTVAPEVRRDASAAAGGPVHLIRSGGFSGIGWVDAWGVNLTLSGRHTEISDGKFCLNVETFN